MIIFISVLQNVQEIDTKNKKIIREIGELSYEYLVMATGSKNNYFGLKGFKRYNMAIKIIPQSLNIRSLILENFEQAVLTTDFAEKNSLINFLLVGDNSSMETDQFPQGHLMMTQPALQQGKLLGENLIKLVAKKTV